MAYCNSSEVGVLLQQEFTTISQPKEAEVQSIINQVTGEIDSILASFNIALPITDATTLLLLRKYCSYGSACMVGFTWFRNNNAVSDSQPGFYCQEYKTFLDMLKNDPGSVLGNLNISNDVISSQVLDGSYTETEVNSSNIKQGFQMVELSFDFKYDKAKTQFTEMRQRVEDLRPVWINFLSYYKNIEIPNSFRTQGAFMGGKWQDLNPRYAERKAILYPGQPILRASNRMFIAATGGNGWVESIEKQQVGFGIDESIIPYARKHQEGYENIPQRAFFYTVNNDISKSAWKRLLNETEAYIIKGI